MSASPHSYFRSAVARFVFVSWCVGTSNAFALDVPPLRAHVEDRANVLSSQSVSRLDQLLKNYETQTGHQFAVLLIPSLEGEVLENYSMRVVEAWKLGKKGHDDGLLILIALHDRKIRIEVGYGLEGNITDALSSRVIRNVIVPAFRNRDFEGGISNALNILMSAADGKEPSLPPPEPSGYTDSGENIPWTFFVPLGLFVLLLLLNRGGRRRGWYAPMGGFGGGFGGGGWGGGSGGFSGGGGGFGGGGSSGKW